MKSFLFAVAVPFLVFTFTTQGCGGEAATQPQPTQPTAQPTTATTTPTQQGRFASTGGCNPSLNNPLLVQLKPQDRAEIEAAMKESVVVVSYNGCKDLKLVAGCMLEGRYGYVGFPMKQETLRLKSKEEVEANIPISNANLPLRLEQGESLDLTIITIGRTQTTWQVVKRADLKGKCDGATHFVRSGNVGAFAMETTTQAGNRSKSTSAKDGDLKACASAQVDAKSPPVECSGILQLNLTPISN